MCVIKGIGTCRWDQEGIELLLPLFCVFAIPKSVLASVAANGKKEIVELLIDRGAEVNATDRVRRGVTGAVG